MQSRLQNKIFKFGICGMCILALAFVRAFESDLFYDPFSVYFENDYLNQPFPGFDFWKIIGSLTFRYLLNMIISLIIIYVLFKDFQLVRFSGFLYAVFYIILILLFGILVSYFTQQQNFILFYVRRFLIQPLFLLLFVPAFLYQQQIAKIN